MKLFVKNDLKKEKMKGMKKRLMSMILIAALVLTMLPNSGMKSSAAGDTSGDTYVYIPVTDLSNASRSEGTGIAENFVDTYFGGKAECGNKTLLLQHEGEAVEYDIDLKDSVNSAVLKVYAKDAVVSVKADGGQWQTLTAKNHAANRRGVDLFDLTTANALASSDKKFTVRISNGGSAVVLNALAVVAEQPELTGTYRLDPLGESYLQNVVDVSASVDRYFADSTVPTIWMHTNEYVTFYFDYADNLIELAYQYGIAGANYPKGEVSVDGKSWTGLPAYSGKLGDVITLPEGKTFYLRFTSTSGDAFLKSLSLVPTFALEDAISELYLPLNSLSAATAYGGTGLYENFNDTYLGGTQADNKVLLLQKEGDYVEYTLDMVNDIKSAVLKLYATGGTVEVKPEGGEYTVLTAKNGSGFNRGVAIYELNEENALSRKDKCFTLRIRSTGETVILQSLYLQGKETELREAYELDPSGKSYLSNLYTISAGASRYFLNGSEPTVHIKNGQSAVFHFDYTDEFEDFLYSYTQAGAQLKSEVSADGTNWYPITAGQMIGEVMDLPEDYAFYIRLTAESGDGFLRTLGITPIYGEIEENDYVYIPISDLSNANRFGGSSIVENFTDTYFGGKAEEVNNKTLLLQKDGDYVEYNFNVSDACTSAVLKVYMTDAVVSVKPEGGEYITLKARNEQGGKFNRGVAVYDLSTENALAADNRTFSVRIACNGTDTAVLNGLLMDAADTKISSGQYTLEPLGESFLQAVWDLSQDTTRYFHNGSIPTVFIKNGGYVTFRMNFTSGGASYLASYETLGAKATVEVSLDGTSWSELKGTRVDRVLDVDDTGTYYLRFSAKEGDVFLETLTASREDTEPPAQINTNPNLPKDVDYVYFKVGTTEEEKYMFGMGDDYKAYFEATHEGMSIDGFEGGYSETLSANARIFHGKQVTYEFDLKDSLKEASLKVYGLAGMTFLVSTDDGEIYEELTTEYKPSGSGRGYYIFQLNEANALKDADNKFRLQIKGSYGILFGLLIETETPELTSGTMLEIQNESSLQYLEATSGQRTYYADQAFPNYFLDENTTLIFKVPFAESIDIARLHITYCGDVEVAVASKANGKYTTLLTSTVGSTGTPYTNTYSVSKYLKDSRNLYIKVTSSGSGFVDSIGIAVTQKNEAKGEFTTFTEEEARYLYKVVNNSNKIGTSKRVTYNLTKARGIDAGGSVIYKIDLPDNVNGVDIGINASGQYDLTASIDGENFVSVAAIGKKTEGNRILEPLGDSTDKVLYIKITNPSTEILSVYSIKFSTAGIPNYVRPETSDFDYDKTLSESFETVQKLEKVKDPEAYLYVNEKENNKFPWLWVSVSVGGIVVLAAGAFIIWFLLYRKKKQEQGKKKA